MAEKCVFCKEQIESPYPPRLEENKMFMFEILMEQFSFDKDLLIRSPICDDCDKTILNFFNFKSNFMETEDEFINYMNSDNKVDLYDVLVKTFKVKKFENENVPIRVCRICLKVTQVEDFKEIKSLESKLATMVTTCLPEFNIKLTHHTFLCPECFTIILQYYHFLLLCSEITKVGKTNHSEDSDLLLKKTDNSEMHAPLSAFLETESTKEASSESFNSLFRKRMSSEVPASDPLAINEEKFKDKRRKVENTASLSEPSKSGPSSPTSVVIPFLSFPKRLRGRPRKPGKPPPPTKKELKRQQLANDSVSMEVGIHYECQVCPEIMYTFQTLKDHMSSHEKDEEFFCWRCGYVCYNFGAMFKHYEGHGLSLFKTVKVNESNDTDVADESSTILKNRERGFPSIHDGTEIDTNLLSVKRTDIYTPPDIKQPGKKRAGKRKSTRLSNSTTLPSTSIISSSKSEASGKSQQTKTSDKQKAGTMYFQCQICPGIFNSVLTWTDHISFHRHQCPIECWRCGAWFETLGLLKDHFESHDLASFYKLVTPERIEASDKKEKMVSSVINRQEREKSPSLSPKSISTIPCPQCKQDFSEIEDYMDHVCIFRPNETDKSKEKGQEFACGHCTAVFYSLDDLDEHNCIPMKSAISSGTKNGRELEKVGILTNKEPLSKSQTESSTKILDADYECSYCLLNFNTISGLDNHICHGDSENSAAENYARPRTTKVKKENLFECSYCVSLFETGFELNQHKCDNAPVYANTEAVLDNTEAVSTCDGISQIIKAEPQYDIFLPSESAIETECNVNSKNIQDNPKVSASELTGKDPDDVLKSGNVENQEKPQETEYMSNMKKKNVINKIANMFGVKIVEGKDRKKDPNLNYTYTCIGCDFKGTDQKDLMFHFGFCNKIFRCNYCSYGTNISQKLEIHSWSVHNILIYVCAHCMFVTSMEENYAAHIATHKDQNDISDVVQGISDDEEGTPKSPGTMLNDLFDFENVRTGQAPVSEGVLQVVNNQKEKDSERESSEIGNETNLVAIAINEHQTNLTNTKETGNACSSRASEDTLSAEYMWPYDSDDDLDPSQRYHIPIEDAKVAVYNSAECPANERDPLATEPVWLVKSSSVHENLAQSELAAVDILAPEEHSDNQNQSELIIPDRIIMEPANLKSEPLEDPLNGNNDTETGTLGTSPEAAKPSNNNDAGTSESSNIDNVGTIKLEPLQHTLQLLPNSVETIVINCDSDSDSEFVESSDSRMSNVAASAKEVVTISAGEASKLISEGVPVINEGILSAMQDEASNVVTKIAANQIRSLLWPEISPNSSDTCSIENQFNSGEENRDNEQTDSADEPHEDVSKEKENELSLLNTDISQPESAGDNEETLGVINKEKDPKEDVTGELANEQVEAKASNDDNTDCTKSKSKLKVTIERDFEEEAADSDGSSFFVTDNEDSDRDEPKKKSNVCATKPKQNDPVSEKIVEKPFLPVEMYDGVCISDDDDDKIEKDASNQDVTNREDVPEKVLPKNSSSLRNSEKTSAANTEESFVISDDDEDISAKVTVPQRASPSSVKTHKSSLWRQSVERYNESIRRKVGKKASAKKPVSAICMRILNCTDSQNKRVTLKKVVKNSAANCTASIAKATCLSVTNNQGTSAAIKIGDVRLTICSKKLSNSGNQKKSIEKNVAALKDTAKSPTALNNSGSQVSDSVKKSTPVQKEVVTKTAIVSEGPCVVIDDDDDDIFADKDDNNKTDASRSRNNSSSSSIILDRDFFKEADEDSDKEGDAEDSGNDCVFVLDDSKNDGSSSTVVEKTVTSPNNKFGAPPNALNLFISKVKNEIKQKYPELKWGAQKNIILDAWSTSGCIRSSHGSTNERSKFKANITA